MMGRRIQLPLPLMGFLIRSVFPKVCAWLFLLVARLSKCIHCIVEVPCTSKLESDSIGRLAYLARSRDSKDNEVTTR
ncbi:hypothetical protein HDF08_000419 [Edaphobacter lichenicola]|uniref:Uncharacterized protein n=1 Tax=Tunturiibacter lichenicola TaxID=2051959 RepID=A0A852VFJ3_9BACT|nr:hypothetical protein [Edaphobacter lichenicola]